MKKLAALSAFLLASLACRPVITIGWEEILFVFVLFAILIGPPLFRLFRRVENFRKHERSQEKKKQPKKQ